MCGGIFDVVQNSANAVQSNAVAKGNARTAQSVARVEAKKTIAQGNRNASSARAAAAENGLDVDLGAAALIQDEHIVDAAYNASIDLSDAANQASQIRQQGRMQRNNYGMQAASELIKIGEKAFSGGWK